MGVCFPWGPPGEALISFLGHFYVMGVSLSSNTRPHQPPSLVTPISDCDSAIYLGPGEVNVGSAAASALLKVDGEANIYINVGKERKPERTPRKVKKTWEVDYGSSGALVPIVTGAL